MINLLKKDIKLSIKNIIFMICIVIIFIVYITQCLPSKWYYYAAPMDEMHMFYAVMKDDYKNGHTQRYDSINEIKLSKESKKVLGDNIKLMNPNVKENEEIEKVDFHISYEDYQNALDKLNKSLGGISYYDARCRNFFYMYYLSSAFGTKFLSDKGAIISRMETYLANIIKDGKFEKYYQYYSKTIKLTTNQIDELTSIHTRMLNERHKDLSINELYEKYNNWYQYIDEILEYNTAFGEKYRYYALQVNNSINEALDKYESIRDKEKVTNAYARYYSDYFSILAGILPAFIGAFILIEDRRWKMHEFIYPRVITSLEYVFSKFFSISILFMICFYILSGISTYLFIQFGIKYCLNIDIFAFFKYTTFWVMPTVLITTALSMLFSVLFRNGVMAIMLEIIIFFLSAQSLIGDYPIWKPIIRFNEIGLVNIYKDNFSDIIMNRIFITLASFVLIIITSKLFSIMRSGRYIFHHRRINDVTEI